MNDDKVSHLGFSLVSMFIIFIMFDFKNHNGKYIYGSLYTKFALKHRS